MRIAVVSPFVDRRHGTERALVELIERLARNYHCEIYLYSQRVEGLSLTEFSAAPPATNGAIFWRRVPAIPGPHLLQFLAWLLLNHLCRWRDRRFRRLSFDLTFSPGINCLDANFILVHAVFHRLAELQAAEPSPGSALRNLHRRLYYAVLRRLERRIYSDPCVTLAAVSHRTAAQLHSITGRSGIAVVPNGVDSAAFSPSARLARRAAARARWNFATIDFVLLLIGNDWRTKGLSTLLEATASCPDLPFRVLVVGDEDASAWHGSVERLSLAHRVQFSASSPDVLAFYAAADAYVAPSREDSFNLPVLEAMACGLPAITSPLAGISGFVRDGVDAFVVHDSSDAGELAGVLRLLHADAGLRARIGQAGARSAGSLTWDRHAEAVLQSLKLALGPSGGTLPNGPY